MNWRSASAIATVVLMAGCGPGDSVLQERVDRVMAHPDNGLEWASGTVAKGRLTVMGMAPSEEAKASVTSILSQIPGLKQVADETQLDTLLIRRRADAAGCVQGIAAAVDEHGKIAFSGTSLTRSSRTTLDAVAEVLRGCPDATIEVAGYTDSSGSEAANLRVSERRAQAAVAYLEGRGVAAGRLTAAGYGEVEPIANNGTAAGRAENRRIEFRISH